MTSRSSYNRPNPLQPDHLRPAERRAELCSILALGLVRLRLRQSSDLSAERGENSLHSPADQSGHATPTQRRSA